MFGLKQRPTPSRDARGAPYMLDLCLRQHSGQPVRPPRTTGWRGRQPRLNTVRSFHHEGEARGRSLGAETGAGSQTAKRPVVGRLQASLAGQLGPGAADIFLFVRTFQNLAFTHCLCAESQGFPSVNRTFPGLEPEERTSSRNWREIK